MEDKSSTWLNDGLVLALLLSLLVFALPLVAIFGAVLSAYYGLGTVDWKVLVAAVFVLVAVGAWFSAARWARRGGWKAVGVAAVPLAVFGLIGLVLWLAPGIFGLDVGLTGVAPSIIGVVGLGGLALHLVLSWIAISTAPVQVVAPRAASAHKPPKPKKKH